MMERAGSINDDLNINEKLLREQPAALTDFCMERGQPKLENNTRTKSDALPSLTLYEGGATSDAKMPSLGMIGTKEELMRRTHMAQLPKLIVNVIEKDGKSVVETLPGTVINLNESKPENPSGKGQSQSGEIPSASKGPADSVGVPMKAPRENENAFRSKSVEPLEKADSVGVPMKSPKEDENAFRLPDAKPAEPSKNRDSTPLVDQKEPPSTFQRITTFER